MIFTQSLYALLALCGLEAHSPEEIKTLTQKHWLRGNVERWQMSESMPEKKPAALLFLQEIGCIEPITAKKKHYRYAAVHGGSMDKIKERLEFMRSEWQRGVRFDEIVFLTGQRFIDRTQETNLPPTVKTETDLMLHLFAIQNKPQEWQKLPLVVIDAQAKPGKERPTTGDTIEHWLCQTKPTGDILFISNQPFVGYQHAVAKNTMPKTLPIETVGQRAPSNTKLSVFLDNLARWIYEESLHE